MNNDLIYLDHNATTPMHPDAVDAVREACALYGNPSSIHAAGRRSRALIERSREDLALLLGADPANVIFTSGGTEANNLAITSAVVSQSVDHVVVSALEHESVRECAQAQDVPVSEISATKSGDICLDHLETVLTGLSRDGQKALVCVMAANNEIGTLLSISQAIGLANMHGAFTLVDAVQAVGKINVNTDDLGATFLSVSAHKLCGPKGVGALVVDTDAPLKPLVYGGGQEQRRRSGTENVIGIAGFGAAAKAARISGPMGENVRALRDEMESELRRRAPEIVVYGESGPRLANTSYFGVPGLASELQVIAMDLAGFCVSAGSACSSGKVSTSRVISALGFDGNEAASAIRVSLGWDTSRHEVNQFVDAWTNYYENQAGARLKKSA